LYKKGLKETGKNKEKEGSEEKIKREGRIFKAWLPKKERV